MIPAKLIVIVLAMFAIVSSGAITPTVLSTMTQTAQAQQQEQRQQQPPAQAQTTNTTAPICSIPHFKFVIIDNTPSGPQGYCRGTITFPPVCEQGFTFESSVRACIGTETYSSGPDQSCPAANFPWYNSTTGLCQGPVENPCLGGRLVTDDLCGKAVLDGPTCPEGYTYNASTYLCDQT
jgi:hypothetical protein